MGKIIKQIHLIEKKPIVTVLVSKILLNNGKIDIDRGKISKPVLALIDTGATRSVVSKRIIDEIELKPKGKSQIHTPSNNNVSVNDYEAIISVSLDEKPIFKPNGIFIQNNWLSIPLLVSESEFISIQNIDVILGMDVIMQGHLSISEGVFIFSI